MAGNFRIFGLSARVNKAFLKDYPFPICIPVVYRKKKIRVYTLEDCELDITPRQQIEEIQKLKYDDPQTYQAIFDGDIEVQGHLVNDWIVDVRDGLVDADEVYPQSLLDVDVSAGIGKGMKTAKVRAEGLMKDGAKAFGTTMVNNVKWSYWWQVKQDRLEKAGGLDKCCGSGLKGDNVGVGGIDGKDVNGGSNIYHHPPLGGNINHTEVRGFPISGGNIYWLTDVVLNTNAHQKNELDDRAYLQQALYAELSPPKMTILTRQIKQVGIVQREHLWYISKHTFAQLEYMKMYLKLEDWNPICWHQQDKVLQLDAELAADEGWQPDWWAEWNVNELYDILQDMYISRYY